MARWQDRADASPETARVSRGDVPRDCAWQRAEGGLPGATRICSSCDPSSATRAKKVGSSLPKMPPGEGMARTGFEIFLKRLGLVLILEFGIQGLRASRCRPCPRTERIVGASVVDCCASVMHENRVNDAGGKNCYRPPPPGAYMHDPFGCRTLSAHLRPFPAFPGAADPPDADTSCKPARE
jgi:hypothetical protein